jgi:twitching motility protein PilJ
MKFAPFKLGRLFGGGSSMISDRLAGLVRLAVTLIGVLLVVSLAATLATSVGVTSQGNLDSFALAVSDLDTQLLLMRRNEKDFLARRNKDQLSEHELNYNKALEVLQKARSNPAAMADEIRTLDAVSRSIETYRKSFVAAATQQFALGFDENKGSQGQLRTAVHQLEDVVLNLGLTKIEVSMLTLRRDEKNFILRGGEEYVTKFEQEIGVINQLIATSKADAAVKQRLTELVAGYDYAFHQFVTQTFTLNKAVQEATAAAQAAEEPLPNLVAKAHERSAASAAQARFVVIASAVALAAVLLLVVVLLRGTLLTVRRAITSSVAKLQDTVDRVRAGQVIGGADAVATDDEMGQVWKSVDALLTDRFEAQRKAEAENEALNNSVIGILQSVNQLSQRDLTVRAPVTQDVIGTVSDSINQLAEETSKVLNGVTRVAGHVAEVSTKVRTQAEMVSKTAEAERLGVEQMTQTLASTAEAMNQVAALAEQSNQAAEQATRVTDTALETVNDTVKGMDSIRETISETEKRIKRLGERSQEISGIVNMINTISERTHVLALNASMQAAVAGEAGRGFAVVAEEVQRLAENSRNATQQIATLVNNIQLETNETINTVNRTIGQVVHGSELAQKAGEQMRKTQEITGGLVRQVRHIAASSERQKEMSGELLVAVQKIGESTRHTAQQIEAQNEETETLLKSARHLVQSVRVFKLPQAAAA